MDKLRETGFTFSKKYGQNFLTDGNLLRAIAADAGITKADTVLEIGPGAGALTLALADRAGKVVAYEIDRRLEPVLDENAGRLRQRARRLPRHLRCDGRRTR